MNFRTLIRRNLRYHWRAHLGVVLGAAVGSAALIGALVVGDSVRESLYESALQRLGWVEIALDGNDRLFPTKLAKRVIPVNRANPDAFVYCNSEAMLRLPATATSRDGGARANNVNVLGVGYRNFWQISRNTNAPPAFGLVPKGGVAINEALAAQLRAKPGDEILLRLHKPSALSRDAMISTRGDTTVALRLKVHGIVPAPYIGNFSLRSGQSAPLNAFLLVDDLASAVGLNGKANVILLGDIRTDQFPKMPSWERWCRRMQLSLARHGYDLLPNLIPSDIIRPDIVKMSDWRIAWEPRFEDYSLNLRLLPIESGLELRSERIFLDPPITTAVFHPDADRPPPERLPVWAVSAEPTKAVSDKWTASQACPILTYLVNLLRARNNATPYSMVTAAGAPWTPADLRDDEIVVSQWLAEDLRVKPGDEIALSYFLPESGAKLTEATNTFRVHSIVPLEMPWADRTLMPDFPGLEKAESTSEWDAGFPLVHKIRPKDEEYWKKYRGTPKAFITLAAGQKMWGNRFGNLTAIRFPIPTNGTTALTPALSPGERENRSRVSGKIETGESSAASEKSRATQRLSPLPGGEGQGEGERQTNQSEPPYVVSYKKALEKKILANLKPEELGLRFEPVREQALKAAAESQDFGGLFLGFSFFLIIAALLLMAMLFQFGLEQRAPEIGTLLALGFTPKQVRKLLLREGVALAFLGGVLGAVGGIYFAKAMLHGLTTIWRDAVGATALSFHFTAQTLVVGIFASVIVSAVTIWLALRKFVKRPARELLVGEIGSAESKVQNLKSKVVAVGALLAAVGLVGWTLAKGDTANAGAFFGAGALVLIAGLGFASAWLARFGGAPSTVSARTNDVHQRAETVLGAPITLASLAVRGCARRRKRSLATVAMLACGSFLIVSIGVFRLDANRDATKKDSGTGGFALIGEATMPVVQDLNSQSGREFFALNEADLNGVNFVPCRVREGDEASCLNLNRAQKPRLLGVKPERLAGRFGFAKGEGWAALRAIADGQSPNPKSESGQRLLTSSPTNAVEIPAIGDANSIQWAMHKKVGDTIDYVDERGQPFKVRIVGAVANSILQGQLIIDEAEFVKRFPGESGYRMFLVDAPSNAVSQVSATLSRAMQDVGLELTPAAQRLAQFNAVQNTYLGTFQVLGGLGLLLGSVGLGIVVLRNVLERRGELAVLLAVGFRKQQLQRLLLTENGALLIAGLTLGIIAAVVAVLPAVLSPSARLPYASLAVTLAAVLVNGALWTWAATRLAVRGDLLKALRNE